MSLSGARRWLVAALPLLLLGGVGPDRAGATFPGRNGLLVFTTQGEALPARVVSIEPSHGSFHREGAAPELMDALATWSPDGRRVALVRWEETGVTREPVVYLGSGDGRVVQRLAMGLDPAWSRDGRFLAFSYPAHGRPVFVADLRSGRMRRLATGGGPPAWSPDGTRLVYGVSREFGGGLWFVSASGGKPRRLLRRVSVHEPPAWSPDGRRIAFLDDRRESLTLLDLRTRRTRVVRQGAAAPTWAPKGNEVAYAGPGMGGQRVRVVRADGRFDHSLGIQVATDPGRPSLAWSPDGKQVAAYGVAGVSVVRVATRQARRLFAESSVFGGLAWPRPGRIVIAERHVGIQHVTVSDSDGAGRRILTAGPWSDVGPTWSADGRRIAFASDRDGDHELYVMNADGSGTRQVTRNHAQDTAPSWSPDGTRLAFTTDREGKDGVWTIGVDGGGARRFASAALRAFGPAWSPDGRYIAYNQFDNPYTYVVAIDQAGGLGAGCRFRRGSGFIWSPDASLLMFFEPKTGTPITVAPDCGNPRAVSPPGFKWSPNGRHVPLGVQGDWQPLCTLQGTQGDDTLAGTDGDDVICGLGGADRIDGRGGHDVIYGGPGDDTLTGGAGEDWLFGADGNDVLLAADGEADVVDGGPGNDRANTDPADTISSARVLLASVLTMTGGRAATGVTDPTGDTAGPDVVEVTASNTLDRLLVDVKLANRPSLAIGDVVFVDVDADRNPATGANGVDYYAVFEAAAEAPVVMAWRDGEYSETAAGSATYVDGVARLELPLKDVAAAVDVSATALTGQDPETASLDRAPDSGRWTYNIGRPALRSATVTFTPSRPKAGKRFAISKVVLDLTVAGEVDDVSLECRGSLAGKRLREVAPCKWAIPRNAGRKRLAIAMAASYADRTFALRTRTFVVSGPRRTLSAQKASAVTVGPPETVFDWSRDRCEDADIPDIMARAFRDSTGRVQLYASHFDWRRAVGSDLDHVTHECRLVNAGLNGHRADPATYDGHGWFAAGYTIDGRRIDVLVHNEYHGEEIGPEWCPSLENGLCWFDAVTSAVSSDGGESYRHPAVPPSHLVAAVPRRYEPDHAGMGMAGGTNIVRAARDRFAFYAFIEQFGADAPPGSGGCLIRTVDLSDPTSWRAWDGTGFRHQFLNPYRSAVDPQHWCKPLFDELLESLTYSTYLKRWVLTSSTSRTRDGSRIGVFLYRTSKDLRTWSEPQTLLETELVFTFRCGDRDPVAYSSLLDPSSTSRTFQTVGKRAYLYYTQFHYTNCAMTYDRDLVRVPVEFG